MALVVVIISGYFLMSQEKAEAPTIAVDEEVVEEVETNEIPDDIIAHIESKNDLIKVSSPQAGSRIKSPLKLTGVARGYWFFEASFPIFVTDWNGLIIGEGFATAEGDWMTEEFVSFSAEITFTLPPDTPYRRGTIIFKKDNPSDLPENDDALEIPIVFK